VDTIYRTARSVSLKPETFKNILDVQDNGAYFLRDVCGGVVQVIAKGMMTGQHAYLRSGWNVMDGTLVAVSFLDVFISLTTPHGQRNSFGILRVFRLLRTLRPLRRVFKDVYHN